MQINFTELDMERDRLYGKVYGFYDMSTPWLSIADPAIVKKILVKISGGLLIIVSWTMFLRWRTLTVSRHTSSRRLTRSTGLWNRRTDRSGRWSSCFERHFPFVLIQDLRKGLSPTFSSGKIKGMLDLLDGGVTQMIDHLEMVTKEDTLVNVKDVFQKMALDVIARLTLIENICVASNELLPDALLALTPIPSLTQTTKCWDQGEAYLRSSLFGIHLLQVGDFLQKDSIIIES